MHNTAKYAVPMAASEFLKSFRSTDSQKNPPGRSIFDVPVDADQL